MAAGLPTEGTNAERPRAADVARKDVVTSRLDERLGAVSERVAAGDLEAAIVVNDERVVLGLLRKKELAGSPEQPIERAMRPGPSTFRPYVTIAQMAAIMVEHNLDSSPITTSDGKLVGLLLKADAVRVAHELDVNQQPKDEAS